jgi:hypothetical protein
MAHDAPPRYPKMFPYIPFIFPQSLIALKDSWKTLNENIVNTVNSQNLFDSLLALKDN